MININTDLTNADTNFQFKRLVNARLWFRLVADTFVANATTYNQAYNQASNGILNTARGYTTGG